MLGVVRPRILIADDHALIAAAFHKLLSVNFDVVATVHDGRSLIRTAKKLQPDVVLVDIGMPFLNGFEAGKRIKRALPDIKIIYVTINRDPDLVLEAFRQGASGYLPKTAAASELIAAIEQALKGEIFVSPQLGVCVATSASPQETKPALDSQLTERQIEVLQLLAEGKSMKEAAAVLNLAARTVAFHKYRLMDKLQLSNDAEVVQYAIRHHVVFN
jgi:DNA-binding NarL/FixJ family response regulator